MTDAKMISVTSIAILLICISSFKSTKAYWHVSSTIEAEDEITDLELNRNTANENVLQFTAMGKKFNLPLAPVDDIFAPGFHVYYARSLPNGETKLEVLEESSKALKGTFFQVLPTQGAVYLEKSGDSYQLQGIIDDDKRLVNYQPNSYKLIKLSWVNAKKNPFERANDVASFSGHQILKRKLQVTDKSLKKNKVRIDTLVILDDSHIKRLEAAKISIKKYLGIYWNSVKRRYADIERPKINFRLTGVITADSKLIYSSTFKHGKHLNGTKVLDDLSFWLYRHKKTLPNFDIAMLQTSLDLALYANGFFKSSLLGRAYVKGVCFYNHAHKRMYNCGIGEDIAPVYSGVLTTAHEVAHLLGAPHDGSGDASKCPATDGYLMGHETPHGHNVWRFSNCSKEIMRRFLTYDANCVYDLTKRHIPLNKTFPGEVISLDAACQSRYGPQYQVYKKETRFSDVCNKVWCYRPGSTILSSFRETPEGTSCGKNKVCMNGKCVAGKL